MLNAILYVAEHGCKWRGLPTRFGKWYTIYKRMNRWARNGVLDRILKGLAQEGITNLETDVVGIDSTIVKAHPDGTGTPKRGSTVHREVPRWVDHQDSHGRRRRSNRDNLLAVAGSSPRRPDRT